MDMMSVIAKLNGEGQLIWIIKSNDYLVIYNCESGKISGNWKEGVFAPIDAVIGALIEWYEIDKVSYGGENIKKVKDSLHSI